MNQPRAPLTAPASPRPAPQGPAAEGDAALEASLAAVELRLAGLADALLQRDLAAVDEQSSELHRALARAVDQFSRAARQGPIPLTLRRRLASTSGMVAAQRESFARATAALDRAIDVLLPRDTPAVYGAKGLNSRSSLGGMVRA